jgi:hypothetical protein
MLRSALLRNSIPLAMCSARLQQPNQKQPMLYGSAESERPAILFPKYTQRPIDRAA